MVETIVDEKVYDSKKSNQEKRESNIKKMLANRKKNNTLENEDILDFMENN